MFTGHELAFNLPQRSSAGKLKQPAQTSSKVTFVAATKIKEGGPSKLGLEAAWEELQTEKQHSNRAVDPDQLKVDSAFHPSGVGKMRTQIAGGWFKNVKEGRKEGRKGKKEKRKKEGREERREG
ncbi:hypothetical protein L345_08540, partial [Ophiophagus hannah]